MRARTLTIVGLMWLLVAVLALRYAPSLAVVRVVSQNPAKFQIPVGSLLAIFLIGSFVLGSPRWVREFGFSCVEPNLDPDS